MTRKRIICLLLFIILSVALYFPTNIFALDDSYIISSNSFNYQKESSQVIFFDKDYTGDVLKICLNNSIVDSSNYDISSDYISLKSSFLETLESGDYQVDIYYAGCNTDSSDEVLNLVVEEENQVDSDIIEIISNPIFIDQMESIIFEYDDEGSLLDSAILFKIYSLLSDAGIDYEALGYSFVVDFFNNEIFDYNGFVKIFKNGEFVCSVETSVVFNNTNDYSEEEAQYVDDFIQNNEFSFEKEILLEEYDDSVFNVDEFVSDIASKYDIVCKSSILSNTGKVNIFKFACFYNNKFYGFLTARLDVIIKIIIPANIKNDQEYAINVVRNFFVNYYNNKGISDYITNDTELFFDGEIIGNKSLNIELGRFHLVKEKKNEAETNSNSNNDDNSISNNDSYNNSYNNYNYNNYYYEDDYVENKLNNVSNDNSNNSSKTSIKSDKKSTSTKKKSKTKKKKTKSKKSTEKKTKDNSKSTKKATKTTKKTSKKSKKNTNTKEKSTKKKTKDSSKSTKKTTNDAKKTKTIRNDSKKEKSNNVKSKIVDKTDNNKNNVSIPTKILLISLVSISLVGVLLFSIKK